MEFIKKQIELNDTIIIHGHKKPDGDCYGSQFKISTKGETLNSVIKIHCHL